MMYMVGELVQMAEARIKGSSRSKVATKRTK